MSGGHLFPLSAASPSRDGGAGNLGNDRHGVLKKALVVLSRQCDCQAGGPTLRW